MLERGDARVLCHDLRLAAAYGGCTLAGRQVEVRLPLRLRATKQLGVEEGDGVVELEDEARPRGDARLAAVRAEQSGEHLVGVRVGVGFGAGVGVGVGVRVRVRVRVRVTVTVRIRVEQSGEHRRAERVHDGQVGEDDEGGHCPAQPDQEHAREVCAQEAEPLQVGELCAAVRAWLGLGLGLGLGRTRTPTLTLQVG